MILSGPARDVLTLPQGLLMCDHCGRALTIRYTGNGGIYPCYLCNWKRREGLSTRDCKTFRCDVLDRAVAEEVRRLERFSDDALCHYVSEAQAKTLKEALEKRFAECGLQLHPEKIRP